MKKRKGPTPVAIGMFGAWLLANIGLNDWTYEDCAKRINLDRRVVCTHVRKKSKPEFQTVVTYCWAFGMKDDPNKIWKFVQKDWG